MKHRNSCSHKLVLPWPPTVNHYWRCTCVAGKSRVLLTAKGKRYRKDALQAINAQRAINIMILGDCSVSIDLYPPDKRKRDIDNTVKALLDVLTHGGVWEDDCQVRRLTVAKHDRVDGGMVQITVTEI